MEAPVPAAFGHDDLQPACNVWRGRPPRDERDEEAWQGWRGWGTTRRLRAGPR